jgi:hypothetical protein
MRMRRVALAVNAEVLGNCEASINSEMPAAVRGRSGVRVSAWAHAGAVTLPAHRQRAAMREAHEGSRRDVKELRFMSILQWAAERTMPTTNDQGDGVSPEGRPAPHESPA